MNYSHNALEWVKNSNTLLITFISTSKLDGVKK